MHHASAKMAVTLKALRDRIKGPHPTATIEPVNILLKGAQQYVGGEQAGVDGGIDDDDKADPGMELTIGDFDTL